MRNLLQYFAIKKFPELHHSFLMTGWTKISPFTGEGEEILMMTFITFHSCKALMKITAIKVFVYNIHDIWTPKTIPTLITIPPHALQLFKIGFNTTIILTFPRASGCIRLSP